jgi:hypothetical protein
VTEVSAFVLVFSPVVCGTQSEQAGDTKRGERREERERERETETQTEKRTRRKTQRRAMLRRRSGGSKGRHGGRDSEKGMKGWRGRSEKVELGKGDGDKMCSLLHHWCITHWTLCFYLLLLAGARGSDGGLASKADLDVLALTDGVVVHSLRRERERRKRVSHDNSDRGSGSKKHKSKKKKSKNKNKGAQSRLENWLQNQQRCFQ